MKDSERHGGFSVLAMARFGLLLGVTAMILCLPVSALAEFYKYRDADGVLRFTDNLAEIPPDQRPDVDRYKQVEDFRPPTPDKPKPTSRRGGDDEEGEDRRARSKKDQGLSASELAARYQELNDKKAELDAEYQELVAAQEAIREEREAAETREEKFAINQKVMTLNQRIGAFEKKRAEFEQEVQAFNEQR